MTATAKPPSPGRTAVDGPDRRSLEARASLALKIVAVAYIASLVLALIPGRAPVSTLMTVAFNVASAVVAIVYLAVARGLDHSRPWAEAAVRPLLVILAAAGTFAFAFALAEGRIRIPFEVVLAVWALITPRDAVVSPRTNGRTFAALAVALVAAAVMWFGSPVFDWGGALDVRSEDLAASLVVDCGPAGGSMPDRVTVTYDWRWARAAPLPNEIDMVVIGWSGEDDEGRPLYTIKDIPDPGRSIRPGLRGELSFAQADAVQQRAGASYRWGIDLATHGYQPSKITLGLALAPRDMGPAARTLTVIASYVHLDVWHRDAQTVTCAWPGGASAGLVSGA